MSERELVYEFERRATKDRKLAAGLQPATTSQFVELSSAGGVCQNSSGDAGMSKRFYREGAKQGTQAPSPAPRLIPAETEHQPRTNIGIGSANGGTSQGFVSWVPHGDPETHLF